MVHRLKQSSQHQTWQILEDGWHDIPIVRTTDLDTFNRVVGYAALINSSEGRLLYRGQIEKFDSLKPSALRNETSTQAIRDLDKNLGSALNASYFLTQVFGKRDKFSVTNGWKEYRRFALECLFQHYGAKTRSLDFVDNHWTALWFASHYFDESEARYKPTNNEYCYIFLFVAENGASIEGLSIGENSLTLDLRTAFSSMFLRPAAQHAWAVKGKSNSFNFNSRVAGILEIRTENAFKWLGDCELTSESNFFPLTDRDSGYSYLLSMQKQCSPFHKNHEQSILSKNFLPYTISH